MPQVAGTLLARIEPAKARELIQKLPPRQAVALLEQLDETGREATLGGVEPRAAQRLRDLLRYPPDTAGR